ncbi:MAG TPA: hypothetical protein VNL36_04100 [Bacteroidota bacterium]|nr:hypothetical protein [Bacteroidota bacterium]
MQRLTLESFLTAHSDMETSQFQILASLKTYYDEFRHTRLYPALAELIDLVKTLEGILQEQAGLEQRLPQELKTIDWRNKKLVFEPMQVQPSDVERVMELIRWSLPHLYAAIEEGRRVYDFVDENLRLEEVGLMPMYREEGYAFVPENRASLLHLLKYEVSLFTAQDRRFRTIKTRLLKSLKQQLIQFSPEYLKLQLLEEHHDLPNPATFQFTTDFDFPFAETILPVAKRKLMARVCS